MEGRLNQLSSDIQENLKLICRIKASEVFVSRWLWLVYISYWNYKDLFWVDVLARSETSAHQKTALEVDSAGNQVNYNLETGFIKKNLLNNAIFYLVCAGVKIILN